jgi:polyphosphate glucokinase
VEDDEVAMKSSVKAVLAVDVGGSSVKILATGQSERRSFSSGPTLTPRRIVSGVKKLAGDWRYDVVSIGYPGAAAVRVWVSEPPAGNKQQRTHSATPINVFPWQCRWACPNFEVIAWRSKSILMTI